MNDYFLILENQGQWLSLFAEIDCVESINIDEIGTIYEIIDNEFVAIDGYHINIRTQGQNDCLESLIGEFCISPPVTPYRVWA